MCNDLFSSLEKPRDSLEQTGQVSYSETAVEQFNSTQTGSDSFSLSELGSYSTGASGYSLSSVAHQETGTESFQFNATVTDSTAGTGIWAFLQDEADGIANSRLVAFFASRQVKEHIGADGARNDKGCRDRRGTGRISSESVGGNAG